ncbi:MAG: hypothetical protein ABI681_00815 [Gemmatimonadales bacterium]
MEALVGGGNAILLLLTGMAVVGALLIAFIAFRRDQPRVARTFLGGGTIIALLYAGGVIAASAGSSEKILARGETKWFCGFYLDCHLGMSVESAEKVAELPAAGGSAVKPTGVFHVVTLQLHNNAKNPRIDMLLYEPEFRIVDALGNEYARSAAAEAALATGAQRPGPLGPETKVTHQPIQATIAFDLPANVQRPRLLVSEGWILDRVIERGLINDENSILHKRTLLALDDSLDRTASGPAQ